MNIFAVDKDPTIAARSLCDAHVIKMTLESAQMLSTARILAGEKATYKATHKSHPCTVWVRKSKANYLWLLEHAIALGDEYKARYGKTHKTSELLLGELSVSPASLPDASQISVFALAMPPEYKNDLSPSYTLEDAIEAYRKFYNQTKRGGRLGTWKRNQPEWWTP